MQMDLCDPLGESENAERSRPMSGCCMTMSISPGGHFVARETLTAT
jgi:hypothetical protein